MKKDLVNLWNLLLYKQKSNFLKYIAGNLGYFGQKYSDVSTVSYIIASKRGASDSIANFSMFSNPADAQNISCLGLCGMDICPKSNA